MIRRHRSGRRNGRRHGRNGQALVEFSIVVIPFLMLLMGVVDLGRGIYAMNGTSEAAREIARVTSTHLWGAGNDVGTSSETLAVVAAQRNLIPGLVIDPSTDIVCVDSADNVVADRLCRPDGEHFVRVYVEAPFSPVTPLVSAFGTQLFSSTSRTQVQLP